MTYLKRIIYGCKNATLYIEKGMITKLTLREKMELRIHLIGCSVCKLYGKQSQIINEMVQQLFISSMQNETKLDDAFKKDLQERIEIELNK